MPTDVVASGDAGEVHPPAAPEHGAADDSQLLRGVQLGVVAYLLWGFLTVYWKELAEFDPVELIAWRIISASVVMAALVTLRGSWRPVTTVLTTSRTLGLVAAAAVLLTTNWMSYVYAVVHEHVLETALGYFMAPLGTMAIGIYVLGEIASRVQYVAMLLATAAVVVLTVSYGRLPLAALLIAVSWSLYGLTKRRLPTAAVDSFAAESFVLLVPAIVAALIAAGRADSIARSASGGELTLALLSGIVTATPLVMFAFAATRVPFTVLGPIQYLVPTINLVLGWAVYDEEMPASRLAGFACVWIACALVAADQFRRRRT